MQSLSHNLPLFAAPARLPRLTARRARTCARTCPRAPRMADDGGPPPAAAPRPVVPVEPAASAEPAAPAEPATPDEPEASGAAVAAAGKSAGAAGGVKQYSLQTRLREETEAPFRKVRMFVYAGSAASAGVGALIASLRVVAALAGVSGVQPLAETVPNVLIDLCVVGGCAFLLSRERAAGERRLQRMSRGARLARLRVADRATGAATSLAAFRGRSRVVVLAGPAAKVIAAAAAAEQVADQLQELDFVVAPLATDVEWNERPVEFPNKPWVLQPFAKDQWLEWYEIERDAARFRLGDAVDDLLVVVVRRDGKVGARSAGEPAFERLVEEARRLPTKDQYGVP